MTEVEENVDEYVELTRQKIALEKENAELKEAIKFNAEDYKKTLNHYLSEINDLKSDLGNKVAQIEKMKCCKNCQKSKLHEVCNYRYQEFDCKKDNYKEWELAE